MVVPVHLDQRHRLQPGHAAGMTPLPSTEVEYPPYYLARPIDGRHAYAVSLQTVFPEWPQGFIVDLLGYCQVNCRCATMGE
jgi:hypothetical protein